MRTAGTEKWTSEGKIDTKPSQPHTLDFIVLYGCHVDYEMLRVRFKEPMDVALSVVKCTI